MSLRCMSFTSKGTTEVLVAGHQDTMFLIDVEKGLILREISTEYHYNLMRQSKYICGATPSGTVAMLDFLTFKVVKVWKAHQVIMDMDARSDFLVTCGHSNRHQQTMTGTAIMLDPLANVFDLKSLSPLPPIPFHAGAAHVRMHPRMSTTAIVASHHGQMQVVDLMNPNAVTLRQANVSSYLTHLELAPSGEALVMADQECMIYLWGPLGRITFTDMGVAPEFADIAAPLPQIDWHADTSVGLPYYRERLLSAWPSHLIFEVGSLPTKVDPDVLATLKPTEFGGYAPNRQNLKRNYLPKLRPEEKSGPMAKGPKFLSEKARDPVFSSDGKLIDVVEPFDDLMLGDGSTPADSITQIPSYYQNVEIKYSRFGVDDFDFKYYNKTDYSGLETHIANSYANALLQLIRFTPLLRNAALQHAATACINNSCLLCELGFLFDMLESGNGLNCQATNFLKTFSSLPHVASLGLLEEESPNSPLSPKIQTMTRFLLDSLWADHSNFSKDSSEMDRLVTIRGDTYIRCMQCQNRTHRASNSHSTDLQYPRKVLPRPRGGSQKIDLLGEVPAFSEVLKGSIEAAGQTRGWCDKCRSYKLLETQKRIESIPEVLMINSAIQSEEAKQYWKIPGWLPERIGIFHQDGSVLCFQGPELVSILQDSSVNVKVWELIGAVADIRGDTPAPSHLVALIDVNKSTKVQSVEADWHLFNDFLVKKMSKLEALKFSPIWKLPSVISYQRLAYADGVWPLQHTTRSVIDNSWKESLNTDLLYYEWPGSRRPLGDECQLLSKDTEAPRPKGLIAIDSEFVALQQEEIEVKADGTRETIRPSRLALARLSICRGSGMDEGVPFIDDYIETKEPIIDYLTSFSGIRQGDLDPRTTYRNLVPLKFAYKKMWVLLNLGCVFVGHGLIKDFRTINIHVPKAQVIDTVDLFQSRTNMRKLKLRFLSWLLLKEDIQTRDHDSIEDARTALKLFRKWEEFTDAGVFEETLAGIYRKGRELGFNPPTASDASASGGTDTPPILRDGGGGGLGTGPNTPTRKTAQLSGGPREWTPGKGALIGFGGSPLR
ncbi:MAG: poly(A)-specific ribonuclease [Vezdaea aestivalis]|nr:MAG: poly(A)-specific ribonuclease [Vezdaea aestivalis]